MDEGVRSGHHGEGREQIKMAKKCFTLNKKGSNRYGSGDRSRAAVVVGNVAAVAVLQ